MIAKAASPNPSTDQLTTKTSHVSVADSVARLTEIIASRGLKLFAVIDHSGEARAAGLELRDTKVVMFGSPEAGTPGDAKRAPGCTGSAAQGARLVRRRRDQAHLHHTRHARRAIPARRRARRSAGRHRQSDRRGHRLTPADPSPRQSRTQSPDGLGPANRQHRASVLAGSVLATGPIQMSRTRFILLPDPRSPSRLEVRFGRAAGFRSGTTSSRSGSRGAAARWATEEH